MTGLGRGIVAAFLGAALAGCAVTGEYRPPALKVPARWSEAPAGGMVAALDGSWWKSFGDPELDSLIDRALRGNLDLQLAKARVREARARGFGAEASRRPSVKATASVSRQRESQNAPNPVLVQPDGKGEPPGRPENLFQAGFDATWELDLFGGARRTSEAAEAEYQSVAYDLGAVLLSLVAEVSRNYIELRGVQQQRRMAGEALAAQQDLLHLVRSRQAAGMASDADVVGVEAELQRTESQLPPLEVSLRRAVHRLSVLVGDPAGALAEELAAPRPIPVSAVDPPLGLPSELLRRRPDIRSAERIVAAASARLDASTADLYPKFSLLGTAGLASVTAGDFFNPSSLQWSVGPSLTWPIFRRGMIKATIEVRDAQKQQALISYRRAILTGIEDVENAITAYRQERSRRTMLAGVVESRQRAAHLARETYAGGLTDFRTFLNAKRDLLQAQGELAQSTGELSLSLVALYKALGGGWSDLPPWEEVTGAEGRGKLK